MVRSRTEVRVQQQARGISRETCAHDERSILRDILAADDVHMVEEGHSGPRGQLPEYTMKYFDLGLWGCSRFPCRGHGLRV
jgi:hypothetical protein